MNFILLLAALGHTATAAMLTLNCTTFPQSCNNDCYGIFSAGQPSTLNWDMPSDSTTNARRRGSGCTMSNGYSPCSPTRGVHPWNASGPSCDEYPYASVTQGGRAGAVLRCMSQTDNSREGRFLQTNLYNVPTARGGCGNQNCQFSVMFDTSTTGGSPLCAGLMRHANDGREFKMTSQRTFVSARDETPEADSYALQEEVPAGTLPMHMRREFLLSNGHTALLGSTDMLVQIDGQMVATESGPATVVRELFGMEKSEPFRPGVGAAPLIA